MSSSTRAKQRQAGQEPPKKKARKAGTQHATPGPSSRGGTSEDSSQQPRTQDTLLNSSGSSDALSTLPSSEDYNERTPERTDLLTRLKSHLEVDYIPSTFWACCQLSDTERLKYLVELAETNPHNVLAYRQPAFSIPSLCKPLDFQDLLRLY
jgi:hypothetical protein